MKNKYTELIAREDIERGDIIVKVWKKYCRPAISSDFRTVYISNDSVKKGRKVKALIADYYQLNL